MKVLCRGLCGLILGCLTYSSVCAQLPTQYAFRVNFVDKTGSPTISNPLAFLSQRALDRRTNKNIAIAETDRPVSPDYIDSVLTTTGGKLHVKSRWFNSIVVLLEDSTDILALKDKPYIISVGRVGYFNPGVHKNTAGQNPLDPFAKTTAGEEYYGNAYEQTVFVNGNHLHDRGYKGQGMVIAVIDDGFEGVNNQSIFDSLNQSGRIIDQFNFVADTSEVFVTGGSHGRPVLSLMAANMPGTNVGTAPYAQYALYISEYLGGEQPVEFDQMVAAIERADSVGADVISSSVGYNGMQYPFIDSALVFSQLDGKTTLVARAINTATTKGILCVITAGNEGNNSWKKILTPGDADSCLTIGFVNEDRQANSQSGYGPNAAGHIKPNISMLANATSYATPQLAGWAACLMQASSKSLSIYDIRRAIQNSAHLADNPDTNQLGYGIPDFGKAFQLLGLKDTPGKPNSNWLSVRNNPFGSSLRVVINMPETADVSISLTDVGGKRVYQQSKYYTKGQHELIIETPATANGIYFLNASSGSHNTSIKLLKQ